MRVYIGSMALLNLDDSIIIYKLLKNGFFMKTSLLPYQLPTSSESQIAYLANILELEKHLVIGKGQKEKEAMAAVIMYRHLDRQQKSQALQLIHSITDRKLIGKLVEKISDTQVNPQWGVWSLSNNELLQDKKFHDTVNTYASWLGLTVSAMGAKEILQEIWTKRRMSRGGWVNVVVWGSLLFNTQELNKVNAEVLRRSSIKSSELY